MKKRKRCLAVLIAMVMMVSVCIGNSSMLAFATETTENTSDAAAEVLAHEVEAPEQKENVETLEAEEEEKNTQAVESVTSENAQENGEVRKPEVSGNVEENDEVTESGASVSGEETTEILETEMIDNHDKESTEANEEMNDVESGDSDPIVLNMEAIETVTGLFKQLPSASEIENLTEEELECVKQQTMEAIDAFEKLGINEINYFVQTYPELYNNVMEDLSNKLAELTNQDIQTNSLLPLEEVRAYLVLSEYTEQELANMSVDTMIGLLKDSEGKTISIDSNATTIWRYVLDDSGIEKYEEYSIGNDEKINLYPGEGVESFQMELVIGRNGQLNPENKRYLIYAEVVDNFEEDFEVEIYIEDSNGERIPAVPENCNKWDYIYKDGEKETVFDLSYGSDFPGALGDYGTVLLNIKSELPKNPRVEIKIYPVLVYDFGYVTIKQELNEKILNQKMEQAETGYEILGDKNTDSTFQVVTYVDGVEYNKQYMSVRYWNWYPRHEGTLFVQEGNEKTSVYENINSTYVAEKGVSEITFELKEGYSASDDYYFDYDFVMQKNYGSSSGTTTNYDALVKKVVIGHYDSIEEAEANGAEDITEEILRQGYLGRFDGNGLDITVFKYYRLSQSFPLIYDTLADKVNVKVVDNQNTLREYTEAPIIGKTDPWFRITGANDSNGTAYDTYIIENGKNINIDTMYGYGYQTVFFNDNVDSFIPVFWKADDEAISIDKIYANGSEFQEGSMLSFPEGQNTLDATFSVIITDKNGSHPKNYDVTFVKKTSGPQLYVAGPLAPDVRSVFLDEYHENKHDIFIANIGDEPLKDLWLDLDATNVELDDYWTIGGEGNNTLAACPDNFSLELDSTSYGELSNVAKIRLVPPASGKGEIEGTLKIYSGQEGDVANSELLATILLSDLAQNPEIITEEVDDAVKYVPYSYLITTNNMYDWVNVSYKLISGSLPEGIDLIEETGELYGVPQEAGTFTFTVSTEFESTSENYAFTPSTVELTLTVNDNTDDNVFNATDAADKYSILDAIGMEETAGDHHYILEENSGDQMFRSEGEFDQFVDVWLNGEKLERGVDYTAEEGSTRITIKAQTFNNKANQNGQRNTIAAEYRTADPNSKNDSDNSNELKRTSQNFYIEKNTHTHTYDSGKVTTAATCTANGVKTYTCTSCGDQYTEIIPALGHTSGGGVITKKATCMENGEISYHCVRCNIMMKTEVIVATGHTYEVTVTPGKDCQTDGIRTYTCRKCGDTYTEKIPAAGHRYTVETTVEPTETEDGVRTYTCSVCGKIFTEVIPALGDGTHLHTYDEGVVTKEASCLENGMMTYTCTQCGAVKQETILATGHVFTEEIVSEATCLEAGEKKLICTYCGNTYTEMIPATGHKYNDGVVTKEPTETETGIRTYTCTICGNSYTEVIPMRNSDLAKEESENGESGNAENVNTTKRNSKINSVETGDKAEPVFWLSLMVISFAVAAGIIIRRKRYWN